MTNIAETSETSGGKPEGNTNSSGLFDKKEYRSLFFTWNNYNKEDIETLITYFESRRHLEYVFQEEIGEKGTPHLQGCFKSKSAIKFHVLKNKFPKIHWEKTINWNSAVDYCTKEESRNGEIYKNIIIKRKIVDPLNNKKLHDWQQKIIDFLNDDADERSIHWYYDPIGCKGKTTLAKHLCIKYPNNILYVGGKANDIKYAITQFTDNPRNDLKLVIFDFSRTIENYVSYQAIEEVKNGIFFNNKYEAKMVVFNSPHVVVFSNFEPDTSTLSADRWIITKMD